MNARDFIAAAASLAMALAVLPLPSQAQQYPAKPIKVVVGYSAGGAVDIVARTLGQSLSSSMGQPVIVENKPGAGTNIAVKSVIDAPADGYTLLLAANALAANMSLYTPAPFDAEKDLIPVSLVGRVPSRGEIIPHPAGIEFEVLDADPRRVKRLRVHVPQAAARETASSGKR